MQAFVVLIFAFLLVCVEIHGWGVDGHLTICKIAQSRLSKAAEKAVKDLLPAEAEGDLGSLCSWADRVRFRYHWSAPLHFINTPQLCSFKYSRDCKDEDGVADRCVAGAVNNYTMQLLDYGSSKSDYNLTEALLFLSHFVGDIHQPLHVSFADDKGGNTIDIRWYRRKSVLHHAWDVNIIETAEERYFDNAAEGLIEALKQNITKEWQDDVAKWELCGRNITACPDIYASEGIKAACQWAYKGVRENSVLGDEYFLSRLPIVYQRLAQGGVRLASILNRVFK
ncbi:unnamed protein product [Rhodiola kirilowii]